MSKQENVSVTIPQDAAAVVFYPDDSAKLVIPDMDDDEFVSPCVWMATVCATVFHESNDDIRIELEKRIEKAMEGEK